MKVYIWLISLKKRNRSEMLFEYFPSYLQIWQLQLHYIFYYNYGINEGIHMINFIGKKAIDLKRCLNIFPHIYNQYISAK